MRNYIEIIKKDLGFYTDIKALKHDKKALGKYAAYAFLGLIIVLYVFLFQKYLMSAYEMFIAKGMYAELLTLGFFAFIMVIALFNIPTIIASIYYSNDMKILMRLPFTIKGILNAKIISRIFSSLFYAILITIPIIVKLGITTNQNILFYLKSFIAILFISTITISIIMFIIIHIMRFVATNAFLKKALKYVSTILYFILVVGFQFVFQEMIENFNTSLIIGFTNDMKKYTNIIFPQINLANKFILDNGFMQLLYLTLMALLGVGIIYVVVNLSYKQFLVGATSTTTDAKKKIKKYDFKENSVIKELIIKELKNIISNPGYMVNKLAFGLIVPAAIVVPLFVKKDISLNLLNEYLNMFNERFLSETNIAIAMTIYFSIVMAIINATGSELTSTTFSREGKSIWLTKVLPINIKDQILSRIIASVIISMISAIPMILILSYIISFNIIYMFIIVFTFLIISIFMSCICLPFGILFSNTKWDNPMKAIKSGIGAIIPLVGFILAGLFGFIGYKTIVNNIEIILIVAISILLVIIILSIIIYIASKKLFENRIYKL